MTKTFVDGALASIAVTSAPKLTRVLEPPFNDHGLRINRAYVGCVTKENADLIMALQTQNERVRRLEAALGHIAFGETSELAGNPLLWPSTIAYTALGGRYEDGRRQDTREDLMLGAAPEGDKTEGKSLQSIPRRREPRP